MSTWTWSWSGRGSRASVPATTCRRCARAGRYAILEARDDIGGTWDLFRYPGVRSDSDMHTLGYRFKPWMASKAIADGPSIMAYLRETVAEFGIDRHIRFGHAVRSRRVVERGRHVDGLGRAHRRRRDDRAGDDHVQLPVHVLGLLQLRPALRRRDPRPRAVRRARSSTRSSGPTTSTTPASGSSSIGSGATAMTLVPAMAATAGHVTMLQRSPTYVVSRPDEDAIANGSAAGAARASSPTRSPGARTSPCSSSSTTSARRSRRSGRPSSST